MCKAYRYRIYPTSAQETRLAQTLEVCRNVYNDTLALRKQAWEDEQRSISLYETNKQLTQWKRDQPELKTVFSQVLQNAQMRVDLAFKGFFRRVKAGEKPGYPRFKGYGRYDSFTYPQMGFSINTEQQTVYLSKIGEVKVNLHRPMEGNIKTATLRRYPTGKWFISFSVELEQIPPPFKDGEVVGVDVGLESFATLSTGEKIENPRFFRTEEHALAKAQRKLSRCEKDTRERNNARKVVARVHERISNKRTEFIHQHSRWLVNRFGVICFEALQINNMLKNHHLAKSIAEVAWGKLVQGTQSKAEWAGSKVPLVDPTNTSQLCSNCGLIVKKRLAVRTHRCPHCGLVMDRDQNAAINILRLGLQSLGQQSLEAPVL